jgi:uncharacterized protein YggE
MGDLRVTVEHDVRIDASGARLHVTVRAQSSLAATAAAKKVAEVRALVESLATVGIPDSSIDVTGMQIVTGQGKILASQEVRITLEIAVENEQLPGVLGILAANKGLAVDQIEWMYDQFEASISATADAMRMARRKADAVADAAGLRVVGIASASDTWSMPSPRVEMASFAADARMRVGAAPLDMGMTMSSSTKLSVRLTVDFEVAENDAR